MEVSFRTSGSSILFSFTKDEADKERIASLRFSMTSEEVNVDIRSGDAGEIHNDLIGLSSILICSPFVGSKLVLNFPVSDYFLDKVNSIITKYRVVSSSKDSIMKRERSRDNIPGLAFSGGADSTAALAVMPKTTVPVFLNRPSRSGSMYSPEAALSTCEELMECGYHVRIVDSNLEYIRDPVGFPTDLANAIPAILLADQCGLGSISFGTVLESAYGIGHEEYIDYGSGAHWRLFSNLFSAAGIRLSLPTIGISEVGTAIICRGTSIGKLSQSCIRGETGRPCMFCWKCFRKELLSHSLWGEGDPSSIYKMLKSNEVQVKLSSYPISHENIIAFSIQRIDLEEHQYLKPLADKLDLDQNLGMLKSWFSPSIDFVPDENRNTIRENILKLIEPMSEDDELRIMKWNMRAHLAEKKTKKAQEKLTTFWQDLTDRFG